MAESKEINYEMIVSAHKGNMAAIGNILECLSPQVEGILRWLAPRLSEESLKDCKQEVLIRLIRVIPKFSLEQ